VGEDNGSHGHERGVEPERQWETAMEEKVAASYSVQTQGMQGEGGGVVQLAGRNGCVGSC